MTIAMTASALMENQRMRVASVSELQNALGQRPPEERDDGERGQPGEGDLPPAGDEHPDSDRDEPDDDRDVRDGAGRVLDRVAAEHGREGAQRVRAGEVGGAQHLREIVHRPMAVGRRAHGVRAIMSPLRRRARAARTQEKDQGAWMRASCALGRRRDVGGHGLAALDGRAHLGRALAHERGLLDLEAEHHHEHPAPQDERSGLGEALHEEHGADERGEQGEGEYGRSATRSQRGRSTAKNQARQM